MKPTIKYNDEEKEYALNSTNLAKIGALDDFYEAYSAIKEIYEKTISDCIKEAEKHHKNYWLDNVDLLAKKDVRKICDELLKKHHFIFRTGLSRLYTNAYGFKSFTILDIDCHINHSNHTYEYTYNLISFDKFLVNFQKAVTLVLFYKMIQTKPKYPRDKFEFEENKYIAKFTEQFKLNQDDEPQADL